MIEDRGRQNIHSLRSFCFGLRVCQVLPFSNEYNPSSLLLNVSKFMCRIKEIKKNAKINRNQDY